MISEQKSTARKEGFARRKDAHADRGDHAKRAATHLLDYVGDMSEKTVISGYMPIQTEIDVVPAMTRLHEKGHRLCVPVIVRPGLPLSFREWTPGAEMVEGPFGASVPASGEWLSPDLLIVPLVTYDERGYRLGYGGGFYDRSLELLRKKKPAKAVGFAYAGQKGDVPTEQTDQRLDAMVTELGITRF